MQQIQHTHPSIAKFQQFVELKDYRPPTKKEYVRYVRKLAEHFGCDPLTLSEEQLRQYFLFLRQEKHYTRSPMKAAKFSLRSFFVDCHRVTGWTVFSEVRNATAVYRSCDRIWRTGAGGPELFVDGFDCDGSGAWSPVEP